MTEYQAKDFIQTPERLVFAVVEQGLENGKVLCFLRYIYQKNTWQKLSTQQANYLLKAHYPQYLFFSQEKSAHLHGVSVADISIHYQPLERLQQILTKQDPDEIEQDLIRLCQLFQEQGIQLQELGVTGSLLIGAQHINSDIDLVVFDRTKFHQLREIIQRLIQLSKLQQLDDCAWLESYQRRLCELSFSDYVWHEQRKYNKALINKRKFDLNLVEQPEDLTGLSFQKQGSVVIRALVVDAQFAFDYPAKFLIDHHKVSTIVCYTATYTGQAEQGEMIEVSGQLEMCNTGEIRILVGSTREAQGEYIKVVDSL